MDKDLETLSKEELMQEVMKLREGIRKHRDSNLHELCWFHPELWSLVPETKEAQITVPEWPQFLRGCLKYRESLDQEGSHFPRSESDF